MGQQHNELRRGAIGAAISAAVGDTRGGGVERYGETLTPILNAWGLPEWAYLRGEVLVGDGRGVAAGAATQLSSYAVVNPAGSGMLVVIESLTASAAGAATEIRVGLSTETVINASLATAAGGGNFRDTRWSRRIAAGTGQAQIRTGVPVGTLGVTLYTAFQPVNTPVLYATAEGVVLSPGFAIIVQNLDDAASLHVAATWRERQAFGSELD